MANQEQGVERMPAKKRRWTHTSSILLVLVGNKKAAGHHLSKNRVVRNDGNYFRQGTDKVAGNKPGRDGDYGYVHPVDHDLLPPPPDGL